MDTTTRTISLLSLSTEEQLMIYKKMGNLEMTRISQVCKSTKEFVEDNGKRLSERPLRSLDGTEMTLYFEKAKIYFEQCKQKTKEFVIFDVNFSERFKQFHKRVASISFNSLTLRISDPSLIPKMLTIVNEWKPVCGALYFWGNITAEAVKALNYINVLDRVCLNLPSDIQARAALKQCPNNSCFKIMSAKTDEYFKELQYFKSLEAYVYIQDADSVLKFLWDLYNAKTPVNLKEAKFTFHDLPPNRTTLKSVLPGKSFPPLINLYSDGHELFLQKIPLMDGRCIFIKERNYDSLFHNTRFKVVTAKVINEPENEFLNTLLVEIGIYPYPEGRRIRYFAMDDEKRAQELESFKKRLGRKRKCKDN